MKNLFLVSLLTLSVLAFAGKNETRKAKTTTLKGKVYDSFESLAGVKITVDNNKEAVVYTDFDGNFSISNVPVGVHNIQISSVAYKNKTITVDVSEDNTFEVKLYSK